MSEKQDLENGVVKERKQHTPKSYPKLGSYVKALDNLSEVLQLAETSCLPCSEEFRSDMEWAIEELCSAIYNTVRTGRYEPKRVKQ